MPLARPFTGLLLAAILSGPAAAQEDEGAAEEAPPAAAPEAQAAPLSGPSRADYRIEARLEGPTKRLSGELWLTWTNGTSEAVGDLWFHLYLNAFSNNRSTHLQEADGKLRGHEMEDGWGWSQVKSIEVAGHGDGGGYENVFPSFRYRRPDDDNPDDRTVFSIDLPRPVQPGASVTVHLTWESQLPRVRRRTGYKDDFMLVAQWFPKLGVYEEGRGWNAHQFHMNTEFYSNYGLYDVSLDMPIEYNGKVGASGVKVSEELEGDRVRTRFVAPGPRDRDRPDGLGKERLVHDFTWTADTRYVSDVELVHRTFRFAEWAERFPTEIERAQEALGSDADLTLRDVDITVLIHPERMSQLDRHFKATEAALFFYGLWFGEYPYQHVTVVDPAWGARAAGGMEYPTLFTCGTRLLTTEDMYTPESVTVHECGHQFWYGLVGNNEFEAAWLDEGFNSYTDSEVLFRVYGPRRETTSYAAIPFDGQRVTGLPGGGVADAMVGKGLTIPLPFVSNPTLEPLRDSGFVDLFRDQPALTFAPAWSDPRWSDRAGYLSNPDTDPIETYAWQHADRDSYGTNSYPRTAAALRSLATAISLETGQDGYAAFLRGMRHYAETWRYDHPYPEDFYASFQEGAGVDVDWYFESLFQGTGTVDWRVEVSQARRTEPKGFFQSEGGEFFERPEPEEDTEVEEPWEVDVLLRRTGELLLPVPVRFTFEDGSVQEEIWSRAEQEGQTWKRIRFESEQKLVSVAIDPDRSYYLDADMSNNRWYDEGDTLAPLRWGERVLSQVQRQLHWFAGFGG